jgi:hypothetical protein
MAKKRYKPFNEVMKGDVGENYHNERVVIVDTGYYDELKAAYKGQFMDWGEEELTELGIDLETQNCVMVKEDPRASLEGYSMTMYVYGGEGILVEDDDNDVDPAGGRGLHSHI